MTGFVICAVPDCTRKMQARGWCGTHYARWKRHGSTDKPVRMSRLTDVESRLRSHLLVTANGCWEWQGSRRLGYGRIGIGPKLYTAHRVAASLWLGLELDDLSIKVCHHCDNPPCCNPDHLFLGDQFDNMSDAARKGRMSTPRPLRPTVHPRRRACDVCGAEYEPHVDHRARSKVCSMDCLRMQRKVAGRQRTFVLTHEDVRLIRIALVGGSRGIDIASQFGVSRATVSNIKNGKIWTHVT